MENTFLFEAILSMDSELSVDFNKLISDRIIYYAALSLHSHLHIHLFLHLIDLNLLPTI